MFDIKWIKYELFLLTQIIVGLGSQTQLYVSTNLKPYYLVI